MIQVQVGATAHTQTTSYSSSPFEQWGGIVYTPPPPMPPSRFTELLETLTFTNGSDKAKVNELYRSTIETGYGAAGVADLERRGEKR